MIERFDGGWRPGADEPILAMDSWRLAAGGVVRLDLHEARFATACARLRAAADHDAAPGAAGAAPPDAAPADLTRGPLPDAVRVAAFLAAVRERLPRDGEWFPRVELTASGALQLRLRPCPPLRTSAVLWATSGVPQRDPRTKGADLAALTAARERAVAAGADDALLLDGDGLVLEGATTGLLWWRGDEPCGVASPAVLCSVTRRALARLAGGITTLDATLDDLAGCEVWAVNALHGIRGVTAILGGPTLAPPTRAAAWRERYEGLRRGV